MVDCQNHRHIHIRNSRCIQMALGAEDWADFDFVGFGFEIEEVVDFVLAVV